MKIKFAQILPLAEPYSALIYLKYHLIELVTDFGQFRTGLISIDNTIKSIIHVLIMKHCPMVFKSQGLSGVKSASSLDTKRSRYATSE
jgi:hypothetical protein